MQSFIQEHRHLVLKRARAYVRANGEKIAPEDVAREIELVLTQLGDKGATPDQIVSPDAYLRAIVLHAARRSKRRQTLIEQIAAGDDLAAVTDDLRALDADLPDPPGPLGRDAEAARRVLDELVGKLSPRDALVFALLIEDDASREDVVQVLGAPLADVAAACARAMRAAELLGIDGNTNGLSTGPDTRAVGAPATPEERREAKLRAMARIAGSAAQKSGHIEEPLLALVRGGDQSDDLADALAHLAACADCRARLTDGSALVRTVVVMAIEAPKTNQQELVRAAEGANARLFERGNGRWTAVVAAEQSESLAKKLDSPDSSLVSRIGIAEAVEVPGEPSRRGPSPSMIEPIDAGTNAAEVQAWAKAATAPKRAVAGARAGWTAFAVAAIVAAMGVAYVLANR